MQLRITEKTVLTPGYRAAYAPRRDETVSAPRLAEKKRGDKVRLKARLRRASLTEANLIRLMQRSGVGRPSTYAATLEALRRHGYVAAAKDGRLLVTARGRAVLTFLEENYPFLLEPGFSARIEAALDEIADGRTSYAGALSTFLKTLKGEKEQDV